jgi:peptidoglycan/LPS O-acetylase OafA/YrhL
MDARQSLNRGNNLLGIGLLAIIALSIAAVAFIETDWVDKLDDIFLVALGAAAVVWYLWGQNRLRWSVVPTVLLGIAFLVKIATIFTVEASDASARGDDIGVAVGFLAAVLLVAWVTWRARRESGGETWPRTTGAEEGRTDPGPRPGA